MNFISRLLNRKDETSSRHPDSSETSIVPAQEQGAGYDVDAFDLGWYYNEEQEQFRLAQVAQADRATHFYVVGATGTGKTKYLEFLIRQDIDRGNGFGIIDPHGDLIEDIKGYLACRYHCLNDQDDVAERVVLIDPTDPDCTVTFNPLEEVPGVSVPEQVGELISSFRKIWSDSWGARMEDLMRNTLIALGEAGLTLCELPVFLNRRPFRQTVLEKVTNPTAIDYFRRFDTLTDRAQITWIEPVMNKINAFLADDRMRQMFSSPQSSFNLRDIMDEKKMLLIKLDKGKLKGCADLLGSLFMAKIQMAAFSRSNLPRHERVPFYLYIDEFQNFAADSFKTVLSEARKYGLSLIMAHQSLSQISDDLRSLILSSAGLQVYFRVNRQDANLLAKELFQYSGFEVKSISGSSLKYWSYAEEWEHKIEDLQYLEPRMCFAKHKIQGGIIALDTVEMQPGWEMLEITEKEFAYLLSIVPFGIRYIHSRDTLAQEAQERQKLIEEASRAKTPPVVEKTVLAHSEAIYEPAGSEDIEPEIIEQPIEVKPKRPKREVVPISSEIALPNVDIKPDPKVEREHRRLQHLIKKLAEQSGYLATIEQPTDDGQGRVDVGLESDGRRIACEVTVTTSPDHELANIRKCLASAYELVILCSPERKSLEKVKKLCAKELAESELDRVLFLEPDALALFFEEEAARGASKTKKVKGYKVQVNFQPLKEAEKKTKRQAITHVIMDSFKPQK